MPGMGTGLHTNNPVVVSAFHRELIHQGLVVLVILGLVWVAWRISRARQLRLAHSANGGPADPAAVPADPEPTARRLLESRSGSPGSLTVSCKASRRCHLEWRRR